MKVCFLADLHLFSSEIGGNWPQQSFEIFRDRILPSLARENPDLVIFLGDQIDPHSGRIEPRWGPGSRASNLFVDAIKPYGFRGYMLLGNHDYVEPLEGIGRMGGPVLIQDDWLIPQEGLGFYFFSSRYPNLQRAIQDLERIPDRNLKTKILLMHENISLAGVQNLPRDLISKLCSRFDLILNGHQHALDRPHERVWCLNSVLPWRVDRANCDLEIIWEDGDPEPKINQHNNRFGYWILDTDRMELEFRPVDISMRVVVASFRFRGSAAAHVAQRLIQFSEWLRRSLDPSRTLLRIHLEGNLRAGDERVDIGIRDLEQRYYSEFYESGTRNLINPGKLVGGGQLVSPEELEYIDVDQAIRGLMDRFPELPRFYAKIRGLLERKTLNTEALIRAIEEFEFG